MKNLGKKIVLKSCSSIFKDKSGYVKLIDQHSQSTLFFKDGELRLVFYRPIDSYEFKIGKEAVENLEKGTFFDSITCFANKNFISEMEEYFPEASVDGENAIKYPREEEMDEVLTILEEKEDIKKEVMNFMEDFVSENLDDLGYVNGYEIKVKLDEHLNFMFPNININEGIYSITTEMVETLPKSDVRKNFENELSGAIKTETDTDENLKEEMTSLVSDLATNYIKGIKEPIESKRQIKEKSIGYFSGVISDHLKEATKLTPFERSVHLKELILATPVGDMDLKVKEHLEILKNRFIKKLDLIKRCHLCGKMIKDGFICESCEGEYKEYRSKTRKLQSLIKKVERLYIQEKIDETEYNYLINSTMEELILLQKSGRKFTSLKEFVNL